MKIQAEQATITIDMEDGTRNITLVREEAALISHWLASLQGAQAGAMVSVPNFVRAPHFQARKD